MAVNCPHCQLLLTSEEYASGKCPACNGELRGGRAQPDAPRGAYSSSAPEPRKKSGWGCLIGCLLMIPIIPCTGCLGAGLWYLVLGLNETAWQKKTAEDLKKLNFVATNNVAPGKIPIRDKVLVWDTTNSTLSPAQALLPAERRPTKDDEAFTVVLILHNNDAKTHDYSNGAQGLQRTLTLGVVDYTPTERKALGRYQLVGELPGLLVKRAQSDKSPIVGDTSYPLKNWIETKGVR